jgi:prophage regulatory protein
MEHQKPKRMLRIGAVKKIFPFATSTIYEKVARGEFPKPVPIGPRAVAWVEDEIIEHQERLIANRDGRKLSRAVRRA